MGRNKKRRRTQALHDAVQKAVLAEVAASSHGAEESDTSSVDEGDAAAAAAATDHVDDDPLSAHNLVLVIRALHKLSESPERIHEKQFKDLRRVLHPLVVEQCKVYQTGVDYKTKVTAALSKQHWSLALEALKACKDFNQIPKQGTIQRWVRDVGNISSIGGGSGSCIKIPLLTAILNLGNNNSSTTTMTNQKCRDDGDDEAVVDQDMNDNDDNDGDYTIGLNKHDPRAALLMAQQESSITDAASTKNAIHNNEDEDDMKALEILDHWTIPGHHPRRHHDDDEDFTNIKLVSKILYQQAAADRKPPNHYDLLLHTTTEPGCIQFDQNDDNNDEDNNNNISTVVKVNINVVQRHDVPFVKGGFVLQNVLSRNECAQFMAAATRLGYRPDHPTSIEHPTGIDSCEWLVDTSIHKVIFDRVHSHLPQTMIRTSKTTNNNSRSPNCYKLHSINCRWRFFRYSPESVYRPHIDGSWPESRVNTESGEYETDTSGKTKSFLTFLIYLNQDFDGGQTRFYFSSSNATGGGCGGGMKARGITPSQGCVLVFPQGNTASLLHEGSAVLHGTKLVIRTDVLYSIATAHEEDNSDNNKNDNNETLKTE